MDLHADALSSSNDHVTFGYFHLVVSFFVVFLPYGPLEKINIIKWITLEKVILMWLFDVVQAMGH